MHAFSKQSMFFCFIFNQMDETEYKIYVIIKLNLLIIEENYK